MELFESFGWVVLGGIPTLGTMEFAYRIGKNAKTSKEKQTVQDISNSKINVCINYDCPFNWNGEPC